MEEPPYKFITHPVEGAEGLVRGMFSNRNLQGSVASRLFPGVNNVAILPRGFDSPQLAADYLSGILEKGGNAAAVKVVDSGWLIGAWVSDAKLQA